MLCREIYPGTLNSGCLFSFCIFTKIAILWILSRAEVFRSAGIVHFDGAAGANRCDAHILIRHARVDVSAWSSTDRGALSCGCVRAKSRNCRETPARGHGHIWAAASAGERCRQIGIYARTAACRPAWGTCNKFTSKQNIKGNLRRYYKTLWKIKKN